MAPPIPARKPDIPDAESGGFSAFSSDIGDVVKNTVNTTGNVIDTGLRQFIRLEARQRQLDRLQNSDGPLPTEFGGSGRPVGNANDAVSGQFNLDKIATIAGIGLGIVGVVIALRG